MIHWLVFPEKRALLVRVSFASFVFVFHLFSVLFFSHFLESIIYVFAAAGFANGEEAVNMSAVLTGMGPIPKSSDASRSQPVLA